MLLHLFSAYYWDLGRLLLEVGVHHGVVLVRSRGSVVVIEGVSLDVVDILAVQGRVGRRL